MFKNAMSVFMGLCLFSLVGCIVLKGVSAVAEADRDVAQANDTYNRIINNDR